MPGPLDLESIFVPAEPEPVEAPNALYYGDNLDVLRRYVKDESVALVYLDPPFKSNQDYNVLFAEHGTKAAAQIKAFEDTWRWDLAAEAAYVDTVERGGTVAKAMLAFRTLLSTSDMLAYLSMMAPRLVELHRVLKPSGSLYLHCDPAASHYLKLLLDAIFGPRNFRNEIVWQRTFSHNMPTKTYARVNDVLLFVTRGDEFTFNRQFVPYGEEQMSRYKRDDSGRLYKAENLTFSTPNPHRQFEWRGAKPPPNRSWGASEEQLEEWFAEGRILLRRDGVPRLDGLKVYLDEMKGKPLDTNWTDIPRVGNTAGERLGYPTQKPEALLERVISVSSNEGDVVLDPFCGCGTAIAVAQRLGRRWVGVDITHLAINLIRHRLQDAYGEKISQTYSVVGEPVTLDDAAELARTDQMQFQWWALGLVGARPAPSEQKKGADKGVDGRLYFHDEAVGKTKQIALSVKAGNTGRAHVHELRGVLDREKAEIGVLLSFKEPTKPMREEAASAGFYTSPGWGTRHPRIQLVTVAELLEGKLLDYPHATATTFKKAPKAAADKGQPLTLDVG